MDSLSYAKINLQSSSQNDYENYNNDFHFEDLILNNSSSIILLIDSINKYCIENNYSDTTSLPNILNRKDKEEMVSKRDYFIELLKNTKFEDGFDNAATDYFNGLMNNNSSVSLQWINTLFNDSVAKGDFGTTVKILNLLSDYRLEDVKPNGQLIVVCALLMKDRHVQYAAIDVMEHWMDPETLKMADQLEASSTLAKIMLDKLRSEISECHACKNI